jgi:predicted nucleic acid-binding protein
MTPVFADTFYFVALLNRRDSYHEQAWRFADPGDRAIVTTRAVLMEIGDGFADSPERSVAARFLQDLDVDPMAEIVPLDEDLYGRGLALYRERPDKEWSLTDCISFVVMEDRGIREALTGDGHFAQAGFVPLLLNA